MRRGGSEKSLFDLIVHVSNVRAVPEPGTAGPLGFGILVFGAVCGRRGRHDTRDDTADDTAGPGR